MAINAAHIYIFSPHSQLSLQLKFPPLPQHRQREPAPPEKLGTSQLHMSLDQEEKAYYHSSEGSALSLSHKSES